MKMNFPISNVATFDSLTYAVKRLEEANPQPRIDSSLRKTLTQAKADLLQAKDNYNQALQAKRLAALNRNRVGQALVFLVRDFFTNLRRASRRDESTQAWERLYPPANEVPNASRITKEWLGLAQRVVEAHAKSKGLTFVAPAPTNPTVEEIAASLQAAEAAEQAYRDAVLAFKDRANVLNQAAKEGADQLRWLLANLRRIAAKETPAGRRELLRSFGVIFQGMPQADTPPDPPGAGQEGAVA